MSVFNCCCPLGSESYVCAAISSWIFMKTLTVKTANSESKLWQVIGHRAGGEGASVGGRGGCYEQQILRLTVCGSQSSMGSLISASHPYQLDFHSYTLSCVTNPSFSWISCFPKIPAGKFHWFFQEKQIHPRLSCFFTHQHRFYFDSKWFGPFIFFKGLKYIALRNVCFSNVIWKVM